LKVDVRSNIQDKLAWGWARPSDHPDDQRQVLRLYKLGTPARAVLIDLLPEH